MVSEQIPLKLPHREAYDHFDYLVARPNEEAVAFIDKWPSWSHHALVIYGNAGCGKTHLSNVWQNITKAKRITIDDLSEELLAAPEMLYILENAERVRNSSKAEDNLFFLYNWLKEAGGYLMMTSHLHPNKWGIKLPDLSSRILSAPAVEIGDPDDNLIYAVLVKQFSDRQIIPPLDVINYILPRMERSYDEVRKLVEAIDSLALSEKNRITIPLVRRVFENRNK
jgi:chromosomal replication initiation ATPase DnaA